ncbi:uncharacterized protein LOC123904059 [Trifolium pratense]|uniref:uncharacterized protein LOC123904059 n=1 Tax=Trifolium pratense TaxID=57577 RepID=UPI001E690869|nr:uncharacterized protein LOC123904059 [Trifolium pratense]
MHLKVKFEQGGWWFFTPIYACAIEEKRRLLWNDLKVIANNMNDAWLLAGDFSDIMSADEKRGGVIASVRKCNTFKERVDACNLIDLGAVGPKFTWRGPSYHGGQRIFKRLDGALGNVKWRLDFPDGYVKCWKRESDGTHNLINVERNLKTWKFQTINQVLNKKKEIMSRINGIHRCIQNGRSSGRLCRLENKLQTELNDILKKEELMWFQRSRVKWLIDGDRNTRYYHLKTVSRRKKNNIMRNSYKAWLLNFM